MKSKKESATNAKAFMNRASVEEMLGDAAVAAADRRNAGESPRK